MLYFDNKLFRADYASVPRNDELIRGTRDTAGVFERRINSRSSVRNGKGLIWAGV